MNEREDIKAYLDGELTPEQSAVVERLLAEDPDAAAEAESFRAISQSLAALARSHQPVGLDVAVDRIVRRRMPLWPVLGTCAAVVLLGLVGPRVAGDFLPFSAAEVAAPVPLSGPAEEAPVFAERLRQDHEAESAARAAVTESLKTTRPEAGSGLPRVPDATPPVLNARREVIRNGDLAVKVKDASNALAELLRSTEALGGFVESSSLIVNQEKPVATARLRVPSERFEAAVSMIRGLGTVERESVTGEDVTAQVADYDARARVLANEEQALIEMLRATRDPASKLEVRRRLTTVRAELESFNSQLKALRNLSSLSTIAVELKQDLGAGDGLAAEDWLGKTTAVALSVLTAVGKVVAQGLVFLVVLSPLWVPLAFALRWYQRRQARP
ncbi:MAG: DUF4349 domain-containing protein [Fimbriimonadaceae bacterium]